MTPAAEARQQTPRAAAGWTGARAVSRRRRPWRLSRRPGRRPGGGDRPPPAARAGRAGAWRCGRASSRRPGGGRRPAARSGPPRPGGGAVRPRSSGGRRASRPGRGVSSPAARPSASVRRAGGQHAGRDRRAEHRGADEQVLGADAEPVEQLAEQLLARRQRDHLGGRLGQLGGFGAGRRPADPGLDRRGDAAGQVVEAEARGQERVQVLHGPRVAGGQPPGQFTLGLADLAERGQGQGEFGGPGAGQRSEVAEHERVVWFPLVRLV